MSHFFKTISNTVKYWYVPLITGILFIAVGILIFATPLKSFLTLAIFFSLSFLFSGIIESLFAFSNRKEIDNWGWFLVSGLINVFVGIILLNHPKLSMTVLPLFVGFTVLFRSINAVGTAYDLKHYGVNDWGNLAILGVLGIFFSFFLIWNPVFTGLSIVVWAGVSFLIIGIYSILISLKLRKLKNIPSKISDDLKNRIAELKEEYNEARK